MGFYLMFTGILIQHASDRQPPTVSRCLKVGDYILSIDEENQFHIAHDNIGFILTEETTSDTHVLIVKCIIPNVKHASVTFRRK